MKRRSNLDNSILPIVIVATFYTSVCFCKETPSVILTYERGDACDPVNNEKIDFDRVVVAVNKRLGHNAKAVKVNNDRIQVEVYGEHDKAALDAIKDKLSNECCLEFRILADPSFESDKSVIRQAMRMAPTEKNIVVEKKEVAKWVPYLVKEFGAVDKSDVELEIVKRMAGTTPEALVLVDDENVTGKYLSAASKGVDDQGGHAIHFYLNDEGAKRFEKLTRENLPSSNNSKHFRHLGIIVGKRLLRAPRVLSAISHSGQISGGSMTDAEIDSLVEALDRSSLPSALHFVSEKRVDSEK